tara:strand:+ start:250 stop:1152 length:903 start_codon:yes stop_codon:yes gene_type:complete
MYKDIIQAIVIVLIFVALYFISMISVGLKKLKDKWPEIRCNPASMPFAGYLGYNPMENFVFCIGNIQKNMMGFFLKPIYYIISLTGSLGKSIMKSMNKMRQMFASLRGMIRNIVGDIFGIFMNILIKFQKLILKIKDLIMKLIGTTTVIIYTLQGAMYTGESINRGPIGGTLRSICFEKNTPLKLKSGKMVQMKDIKLGDILENGSEVYGLLQLKGDRKNPYYKIWSSKLNTYIRVTGAHKILSNNTNNKLDKNKLKNYIDVKDYPEAILTEDYDEELACLITSNHNIPIGEYTFWDWED